MHSLLVLIVFATLASAQNLYWEIQNAYRCGSINANLCCKTRCDYMCGFCNQNATHNDNCCLTTIAANAKICGKAPCLIDYRRLQRLIGTTATLNRTEKSATESDSDSEESERDSGFEILGDWFQSQNIAVIIVIALAAAAFLLLIIYSCFFFGRKLPPLPYAQIIDKFD